MIWFIRGGIHFLKNEHIRHIYRSIYSEKGKSVISIIDEGDNIYDRMKQNNVPTKFPKMKKIYRNNISIFDGFKL